MIKIKKDRQANTVLTHVYLFGRKLFSFSGKNRRAQEYRLQCLESKLDSILTLLASNFPLQAKGALRDIQLACLKILQAVDTVCQQHGLRYWLDSGNLLGAMRHGGFIPWDNDIDICMMRQDYARFIPLFNQSPVAAELGLRAELQKTPQSALLTHVRLLDADGTPLPSCCVDIFPYDASDLHMSDPEKLAFTRTLKQAVLAHEARAQQTPDMPIEQLRQSLADLRQAVIPQLHDDLNTATPPATVIPGPEFGHLICEYNAFDYDTIFPLTQVEFEGLSFPAPRKTHDYLTMVFGDYMLPSVTKTFSTANLTARQLLQIHHFARQ